MSVSSVVYLVVFGSLRLHGLRHTDFPVHHHLRELAQTLVHQVGDAIQPSNFLLSPSFPTFSLSQPQRLFQWVSSSHQVAKVLELQIQYRSFQRIFRTDFLLDGLFWSRCCPRDYQVSFPKASTLHCSAFFIVQISHPCVAIGMAITLTRWTFVSKVISLFFNMLSRLVIAFLPGGKCLLISWVQSPSTVILNPKKTKSVTVFIISPSICHEVMGPHTMIFILWMLSFKPAFHSPLSLSSRGF